MLPAYLPFAEFSSIAALINTYAYFSLIGIVVNAALGIFVFIKDPHSAVNRLWTLCLCSVVIWGIGEFLMRLTGSAEAAAEINHFTGVGFCVVAPLFFHFALAFSNRGALLRRRGLGIALYGGGILFSILQIEGYLTTVIRLRWGFAPTPVALYPYFIVWLESLFAAGFYFIYLKLRASQTEREHKQTVIMMIAVLIPLVIGSVTDAFLPLFGVQTLRTSILATTIMAAFVTYGIVKYRLMSLTPETTAHVLLDAMVEFLAVTDPAGSVIFTNRAFRRVLGGGAPFTRRLTIGDFMLRTAETEAFIASHNGGEQRSLIIETDFHPRNGAAFPVALSISKIHDRGKLAGFLFLARDITELKTAERALRASLLEKEALLKEIHHRVKNNMQVMSSLLNLEAGHIADAGARELFRAGQGRIRSMALVHEMLYQSNDFAHVDFGRYLRTLAQQVFQSQAVSPERIALEILADDALLTIASAIPCGLLINELLTNALKYAFPEGRAGKISISFRSEHGEYTCLVADDGVGLPQELDWRHSSSLGMQLVNTLARQLHGRIELLHGAGTAFRFVFTDTDVR